MILVASKQQSMNLLGATVTKKLDQLHSSIWTTMVLHKNHIQQDFQIAVLSVQYVVYTIHIL